ncbi:hypothetical protein M5K25_018181 [Dendrobium thyrsiflorum]|uniref:Uncharacterized protein n=1 Tax=Dendrobium thyrsiflorum TaxID=117978 RepID=A0ABD0UHZ8_DENTH
MAGVVKADRQQEVVSVELPAPPGWKKVFKADVFDKYILSNPMAYVTLGILKFQALSILILLAERKLS